MSDDLVPQDISTIEYLSKVQKNYIGETINVPHAVNGYTRKIKIIGETKWIDSNGIYYDYYKEGCTLQSSGESGNITINILDSSNDIISTNKLQISSSLKSCNSSTFDYIENGYIIRNCTKISISGSENWKLSGYKTDQYMCAYIETSALGFKSSSEVCKSTMPYFLYYKANLGFESYSEGIGIDNNLVRICILSSKLTSNDITGLKAWLAKNNQILVGSSLSTTKEKIVFNQNMLVKEGAITINSDTKAILSIDLFVNKIEEIVSDIKSEITNLNDAATVRDQAINLTLNKLESLYDTILTDLEDEIFFFNELVSENCTDSSIKYLGMDLVPVNLIRNPMSECNDSSINTLYTTCNVNLDRSHQLTDYYNNIGLNTINLYLNCYIDGSGALTFKTTNVETFISYIVSKGMNCMITSQNTNVAGKVTIITDSALKTRLVNLANICEKYGVKILSIGKGYSSYYSVYSDSYMRDIITAIRKVYSGKITYSASIEEANKITWWDACDFIGINFYPIISTENLVDINTLFNGYFLINEQDVINDSPYNFLKKLYEKYNKQIYITEFGMEMGTSSQGQINQMLMNSDVNWEEIQYKAYKSFIKFITNCDFISGCNFYGDCIDYDNWNDVKIRGNDKIESLIKSLIIK